MEVIFIIIAIVIAVVSFTQKAKKAAEEENARQAAHAAFEQRERMAAQAERERRLREEQLRRQNASPSVAPHVAPHAPTVHAVTDEPDCDAHRKPFSSEGSNIRAHAHTASDTNCGSHSEPVSSEGESKNEHLERLRKKKAEMDAQLAYDARYDEQDKKDRFDARIREPEYKKTKLSFSNNAVLQGIIYSEVLKPPLAKRQ